MGGFRRPKQKLWRWLIAITYLLGSLSPSLAVPLPGDLAELLARVNDAHAAAEERHHGHRHGAGHHHDDGDSAVMAHAHANGGSAAGHDGQSSPDLYANCCGSVVCLSAVSPQTPSLLGLTTAGYRCDLRSDTTIAGEGPGLRHRPPIT